MIRSLIRGFQRTLVLQSALAENNSVLLNRTLNRRIFQFEKSSAKTDHSIRENTDSSSLADSEEYIVPYKVERERQVSANALIEALRTRFRLTKADVKRIMNDDTLMRNLKDRPLLRNLEILCLEGVSKTSFLDYPWLITQDKSRLEKKLELLHLMPMRDINHFVPFLRLTVPRLNKLVFSLNCEANRVDFGNRIYYISEKLNVDPYTVSKYLSKRLFILEMPFEMLEQNLQYMIEYKVSPTNILKDLWAFRYTPKSVQLRLERARRAKKDKIMPWMVRCPEPILQRSLKLSLDELSVLGGKSSVAEYVAERLQFTVDETKAIMAKHPQVTTVRVTKIKEVLDYLLDEAGFNRYEIAQVPRILCHSLETTKQRLEELKSLGCRPSSLVIVCRSKREYEKFVRAWAAKRKTTSTQDQEEPVEARE